jgi:hypothetical protein
MTERKRDYAKEWAQRQGKKPGEPWQNRVPHAAAHDPPPEVAAERDRAYGAPQGRTAELMGDPPQGRSALAKRATEPATSVARHPARSHPFRWPNG